MIILDSCVLRGLSLEDSNTDLLRTIRTSRVERVAAPWMVLEELAAQKAVAYRKKYDTALQAVKSLQDATPWDYEVHVGACDLTRLRQHWRDQYLTVVEELPTSEWALREAVFREANALPPCKETDGGRSAKVGSRDAAIWLSAIEYARKNPKETVYFVSSNTRDFGDGTAYKWPMDTDVAGLGDRFVHLTKMDEVITRFAEPTATDEELVSKTLRAAAALKAVKKAAKRRLTADERPSECSVLAGYSGGELTVGTALSWLTMKAQFHSVRDVRTYRIGEHEWCTAVVRWGLAGTAFVDASTQVMLPAPAGCSWTTSVIFRPDPDDPRLTILRHDPTRALSQDEFEQLEPSKVPAITLTVLAEYLNQPDNQPMDPQRLFDLTGQSSWRDALSDALLDRELRMVEGARQSVIERRLVALMKELEADET
ncbi:PIN domain-containing protein [Streptomyces sp. NPDC002134]|uniref:PIN domain-containing protein n=1 Tax=Streptomyces sp. NPDC002134 TaxID=3364632 RepID=UPI00368B3E05